MIVIRKDRSEGVLRVYFEARLPMAGEKGGRKYEANKGGWERLVIKETGRYMTPARMNKRWNGD